MDINIDDVRDPNQRLLGLLCPHLGHWVLRLVPGIVPGIPRIGLLVLRPGLRVILRPGLRVILRISAVIIIGLT